MDEPLRPPSTGQAERGLGGLHGQGVAENELASDRSYATFPRPSRPSSARPSPTPSGAATPVRLPQPIEIAQREGSLYTRLTSPSSWATTTTAPRPPPHRQSLPAVEVGRQPSLWDSAGRYRTPAERAQHEGNPESWGVLTSALARASVGSDVDTVASPRRAARRRSRTSLRTQSASRERVERPRARTLGESTLQEEPETSSVADASLNLGAGSGEDADSQAPHEGSYGPTVNGHSKGHDGDSLGEGETDDDDDDENSPLLHRPGVSKSLLAKLYGRAFPPSPLVKNILKCVLAYYIGELFTFVPFLSDLVGAPWDVDGPVRNAHVVATVAVYFMPARTIGGMVEADLFLLVGAAYASVLTFGSMSVAVLADRYDLLGYGHVFILLVWLGGGYGFLAWVKVVMSKPTISTACSLVSLVCSPILTKEGAIHVGEFDARAISQILLLAAFGSAISNAICFLLWPQSATSKLQADLNTTLTSFGTLLEMLTKTFLLDTDFTTRPEDLKKAIDAHQASFTTLKASLSQAKYEVFDSRMAGTAKSYDQAVASMTRLAQGLTGMRAGCSLQWELLRAREEGQLDGSDGAASTTKREELLDEMIVLERFSERVGPSLQQLTNISKQSLAFLRTSFIRTKAGSSTRKALRHDDPEADLSPDDLFTLQSELEQSLRLFKREHSKAVKVLYRSLPEKTLFGNEGLPSDPFVDSSSPATGQAPNDNLFRIYHFCFNFEEWTAELLHLLGIFIHLRTTEEIVERELLERRRRWGPLAGVARFAGALVGRSSARAAETSLNQKAAQLRKQFSRALQTPARKNRSVFPQIVDGALSSHQVDSAHFSLVARVKLAFWRLGWHLRQPDVRFALKTGAGASILCAAAFIPRLRPLWLEWRGEWGLISYMVIMAPALGATNFLAAGRVLGTALGAVVAVGCTLAFPENASILPVLGAVFSVPCFYVAITRPQYGPASRFVLLTFNLTCLYCFNLREADIRVEFIAFHRFAAVAVGVIWGLLVSSYVWPFEARRELRSGLSEFFLNASYLYERIVKTYSYADPSLSRQTTVHEGTSERTPLVPASPAPADEDFVAMEIELQLTLIRVSGLLASTKHEPRLKGPFPVAEYRPVLTACQAILDSLTAIVRMTKREAWLAVIRRDFVLPINRERREMVGNVVLFLSLLSSAVVLKTPMPAYLPPAAEARERLVVKLRDLEVVRRRLVRGGSESLLYYAYIISMKDVITQLNEVGARFQGLFGIIGGSSVADFEALFDATPDTPHRSPLTRAGSLAQKTPVEPSPLTTTPRGARGGWA